MRKNNKNELVTYCVNYLKKLHAYKIFIYTSSLLHNL